jgi:hypothetical protein
MHRRYAAFKEEFSAALKKELDCGLDLADAAAVGRRRACVKLAIEVERAGLFKAVIMLKPTMRQVVCITAVGLQSEKQMRWHHGCLPVSQAQDFDHDGVPAQDWS